MEAFFFILIGAALFSHSWYLLELYPDGRTMGVFVAGLGLASLIALTMAPMVLTGQGTAAEPLAETTIMKVLIVLWAGYAVGVGAHGIWDFDERAIGFYSAFLAVGTLVALIYFAVELQGRYGDGVSIAMSAGTILLSVLAGTIFFYLAGPIQRAPAGCSMVYTGRVYGHHRSGAADIDYGYRGDDLGVCPRNNVLNDIRH